MTTCQLLATVLVVLIGGLMTAVRAEDAKPAAPGAAPDLWALAKRKQAIHRFSTLFPAGDVQRHLGTADGRAAAIDWGKKTGVTRVFIETFRGNTQADRDTLIAARDAFRAAGIEVSGGVTTTKVGKISTNWKEISCFTDLPTQEKLGQIFTYTAGLFDEIMIDDFWFTDCTCPECEAARKAKTVTIGGKTTTAPGDTWEDYRCELMVRLSRERILAPARKVNPNVKIIIKYPQWYDRFHERGYEVVRETADFDRTWVGTETRDYTDKQWGGTPQYEAYFIMRWLGGMGGAKCGGGWYDPYGTTERTYLEQARQTVLGGAAESMLFCYPSLQQATGPKNVEALRASIPELLAVAEQVRRRTATGIAAYKPPNSHAEKEARVYDFVGMMGLPLAPCHEFPTQAPAAFFPIHALKDADLPGKLAAYIATGKPVLVTDGLAAALEGKVKLTAPNVRVLAVKGDPKTLLAWPQDQLDDLRTFALKPFGVTFRAPNRVALYLFQDGSTVVENFNDTPADVDLSGSPRTVPARGWACQWR